MTPEIEAKLRRAFGDSLVVEFDLKMDLEEQLTPRATVMVIPGRSTANPVLLYLLSLIHI